MAWFKKERKPLVSSAEPSRVPEGLWVKCPSCNQILYEKDLIKNMRVCNSCSYHFRMNAVQRLSSLFDEGHWKEYDHNLESTDPLKFEDKKPYQERLKFGQSATGLRDAAISGVGTLKGIKLSIVAMEYGFIGGSMGIVVGEIITRAIERSLKEKMPLVVVACSGGARMMEGTLSLMQMAKISAALGRFDQAKLPYIAVLTDPTTGGVTASFAMVADLHIAEPNALIGFAGPRVIEQTIRQKLPKGFQRSEFLLEHGMLDMIVDRRFLKETLQKSLIFMGASTTNASTTENLDQEQLSG